MNIGKRHFFSMGGMALAAMALPSCKSSEDEGQFIVIGEVAAMTGSTATFGSSAHAGTELAFEEVNAAGGLLGKQLKLIAEDNQSKAGESGTLVRKLISRNKVHAILGEVTSTRSLEMAPICQKAKIPMIAPAATNPDVTKVGDHIFRVCFIDPFQGAVMSKFAFSRGWNKVAVMIDMKQDYSVGLAKVFIENLKAQGGQIVSEQSFGTGDKDFKAQLTAIKATNPQAIFIPAYYNETALIAKQARELGITVPLLGGDGWDSGSLTEVAGKAIDGCFFSNHFSTEDQNPTIQNFVKKFEAKVGRKPDAMAALGYDAAKLLLDAIKRAGSVDAEAIRQAIATTKDFDGVTGRITLDEFRNPNKPAVILEIKDGKYAYVETLAP